MPPPPPANPQPAVPVLMHILRQHAEQAAFLWVVYDQALLHPEDFPEMDQLRIDRHLERLEAHLDALRIAGEAGAKVARERFDEYPEPGELFVLRMLQPAAAGLRVATLDLQKVRAFLAENRPPASA